MNLEIALIDHIVVPPTVPLSTVAICVPQGLSIYINGIRLAFHIHFYINTLI